MSLLGKLLVVLSVAGIAYLWNSITSIPPMPQLERTWWGAGEPKIQDVSIRPFSINISDAVLNNLNERLTRHAGLTPALERTAFEYGFNTNYLAHLVNYWRTQYNWREREVFLNSVPHFKTHVSGLDLHYIHVKPDNVPKGTRVLPMLIMHGWPGSIREFYDIIPLLTTPKEGTDFVFELILPSLPGYGFSQGASKRGLGAAQIAVVMDELMDRIGHKKYYVQGGDWGGIIATHMAQLYPDNIIALHSNMCFINSPLSILKTLLGVFWQGLVVSPEQAHLMYPLSAASSLILEETGYLHIQATKPDTVGVALVDSPVGLAAYILEKFSTGTNIEWRHLAEGGLTNKFKLTDLLDNVMIYHVTGSMTTAMRLYSETFNKAQFALGLERIPVLVPTACAQFPDEALFRSEFLLKEKFINLVRCTRMERGGHFAAFEEPALLADDIWAFVHTIQAQRTSD